MKNPNLLSRIAVVFVLATFSATPSWAKLKSSSLDSLIDDSEWIIEATVKRVERTGIRAGTATLQVRRAFVGEWKSGDLELAWSEEAHDQSIASIDHDYLLFLKRNGTSGHVAAQYGRSYWRFLVQISDPERANLDAPTRGFAYEYPLDLLKMGKKLERRLISSVPSPVSYKNIRAVTLPALVAYIRERKTH